jgi:hypothetical protein
MTACGAHPSPAELDHASPTGLPFVPRCRTLCKRPRINAAALWTIRRRHDRTRLVASSHHRPISRRTLRPSTTQPRPAGPWCEIATHPIAMRD